MTPDKWVEQRFAHVPEFLKENRLLFCEAFLAGAAWSFCLERVDEAEAKVASLTKERDELAKRLGKPRCLDCNSAGITNCSDFTHCGGNWKYTLEERVESLEKALRDIRDSPQIYTSTEMEHMKWIAREALQEG